MQRTVWGLAAAIALTAMASPARATSPGIVLVTRDRTPGFKLGATFVPLGLTPEAFVRVLGKPDHVITHFARRQVDVGSESREITTEAQYQQAIAYSHKTHQKLVVENVYAVPERDFIYDRYGLIASTGGRYSATSPAEHVYQFTFVLTPEHRAFVDDLKATWQGDADGAWLRAVHPADVVTDTGIAAGMEHDAVEKRIVELQNGESVSLGMPTDDYEIDGYNFDRTPSGTAAFAYRGATPLYFQLTLDDPS